MLSKKVSFSSPWSYSRPQLRLGSIEFLRDVHLAVSAAG
jgi:hypothetical protein